MKGTTHRCEALYEGSIETIRILVSSTNGMYVGTNERRETGQAIVMSIVVISR